MKKLIILADIKEYLPQLDKEEISMSRFSEILNELANTRLNIDQVSREKEYKDTIQTKNNENDEANRMFWES